MTTLPKQRGLLIAGDATQWQRATQRWVVEFAEKTTRGAYFWQYGRRNA
jgi:hypothetical protein